MSISQVQFLLVCFLSVLLDVFGAFFVSLIGEENRFRRMWRWQQDQARREAQDSVGDGSPARAHHAPRAGPRSAGAGARCAGER